VTTDDAKWDEASVDGTDAPIVGGRSPIDPVGTAEVKVRTFLRIGAAGISAVALPASVQGRQNPAGENTFVSHPSERPCSVRQLTPAHQQRHTRLAAREARDNRGF
jgi:hypothetical protein